jgi:hypothetical protein
MQSVTVIQRFSPDRTPAPAPVPIEFETKFERVIVAGDDLSSKRATDRPVHPKIVR